MSVGDQADCLARIKAVLPAGWFTSATPVLDGVLSGAAYALAWSYGLIQGVSSQLRLLTASGVGLDIISADFFGVNLQRRVGEGDAAFQARIKSALLLPRDTRPAMMAVLENLTGNPPIIFEPTRPYDTGGYGHLGMTAGTGLGYGVAGGYGNLNLPAQAFIQAFRPSGGGVASVAGYGTTGGFNGMPGGYGHGALEYASLSQVQGQVTDQDIFDAVNQTRAAGTLMWVSITSGVGNYAGLERALGLFILGTNALA